MHMLKRFAVTIVGVALLVLGAWNAFGGAPYQRDEEQNVRDALGVVDSFIEAGEEQDAAAGRDLVAAFADDPDLTAEGVSELFGERDLFDDYAAVDREDIGAGLRTTPLGTRADIGGEVTYEDGSGTPFQAELVKRNNTWRLTSLTFTR